MRRFRGVGTQRVAREILKKVIKYTTSAVFKNRHVRSYDVPSAFVNTDLDEEVDMVLRGELAELLVKVAPDIYRKYVTKDRKGKAVLYVRLQKALYGLMRAALLFYRKLRRELESMGFEVNPYSWIAREVDIGITSAFGLRRSSFHSKTRYENLTKTAQGNFDKI